MTVNSAKKFGCDFNEMQPLIMMEPTTYELKTLTAGSLNNNSVLKMRHLRSSPVTIYM